MKKRTPEETEELRQRFIKDAMDADDEMLSLMATRMVVGHNVIRMIDAADSEPREEEGDAVMAVTFMMHAITGKAYQIMAVEVSPEMVAQFEQSAGLSQTKH